jgi:heavy metal sensor kinase
MKGLTLRARLTLWYCVVLALVFGVFAIAITWQQQRIGLRRIDRELDGLAATLGGLLRDELSENDSPAGAAHEVQQTIAGSGRHIAIALDSRLLTSDALDGVFAQLAAVAAPPPGADVAGILTGGHGGTSIQTSTDSQWRIAVRREAIDGRTFDLMAAAPLADAFRERRETVEGMWTAIPLLLAVAAAGGLWVATLGLRPITRMAREAARLPVDGSDDLGTPAADDEVGQLGNAFNDLLRRLRSALQSQRQFMADASHELRTPLSVIRSTVDVTVARQDRSDAEYREALETVGAEIRRASRLVDDMMMLARADAGGYPVRHDRLYLDELAGECQGTLMSMARERGVSLETEVPGEFPYVGDEELLRRLLLNLLRNAVQHTKRGGRVVTSLRRDQSGTAIAIRDEGPGIPHSERERIFDRFVQLDSSRRHEGAGLGLPIARWIALAHGGRLELAESSPSGSTFVVMLPERT